MPSDLLTTVVLTEPQASPAAADKSSTCSTGACCCQPVPLFHFDRTAFNLRRVGTARLTARKIGAAGCAASISRHQAGNCTIHRHLWPPSLLFRLPHLLPRTHTSMAIAHAVFLSPAPFFACIIPCASVSFSLSLSLSLARSLARSGARARARELRPCSLPGRPVVLASSLRPEVASSSYGAQLSKTDLLATCSAYAYVNALGMPSRGRHRSKLYTTLQNNTQERTARPGPHRISLPAHPTTLANTYLQQMRGRELSPPLSGA